METEIPAKPTITTEREKKRTCTELIVFADSVTLVNVNVYSGLQFARSCVKCFI